MLLVVHWWQLLNGLFEGTEQSLEFSLLRQDEVELVIQALLVDLHSLHVRVQLCDLQKRRDSIPN